MRGEDSSAVSRSFDFVYAQNRNRFNRLAEYYTFARLYVKLINLGGINAVSIRSDNQRVTRIFRVMRKPRGNAALLLPPRLCVESILFR